ncbi:MAG: YibE/F family protein [Clostridia bacterium]|nr:YibE/F family protein [Clostridia bacterium]
MRKINWKVPVRTAAFVLAAVLLLWVMSFIASAGRAERVPDDAYATGRVLAHIDREEVFYGPDNSMRDLTLTFTAEVDGETVTATQTISDGIIAGDRREVAPGDRITLMNNAPDGMAPNYVFTGYVRTGTLTVLAILFLLAMLAFGRGKGLAAAAALILCCAAVFGCFIPAVLAGRNIYLWTFIVCLYTTVSTLLLIGGAGHKSLAAMLGCLGGTGFAALVMAIADRFLHMTGFLDDNTAFLLYLDTPEPIDLRALLYAAVLIGALGAVMDVAVDISSALHEISVKVEGATFGTLFRSGITIGRDLIGTMSNTLILAYIGSSLSIVLLLTGGSSTSLFYLLNQERIVFELLQALVGSFGILSTLPLTAAISAWLMGRRAEVRDDYAELLEAAERDADSTNSLPPA